MHLDSKSHALSITLFMPRVMDSDPGSSAMVCGKWPTGCLGNTEEEERFRESLWRR